MLLKRMCHITVVVDQAVNAGAGAKGAVAKKAAAKLPASKKAEK
jgi:hypothetical protein